MRKYYVNKTPQPNGDNEVHAEGCFWLSIAQDVLYLGVFRNAYEALEAAKVYYPRSADGCKHCCPEIHKH